MTRRSRLHLLLSGLLLLILAACSTPQSPEEELEPVIHEFSATGLAEGEGEWLISWRVSARSVTLNGKPVELSGSLIHDFAPPEDSATRYTLLAHGTSSEVRESLTVAPVSGVTLTDAQGHSGPFRLSPGDELQLQAEVHSAGAENAQPSQEVNWRSEDETVITVDENGLVQAVGLSEPGTLIRVSAESRQYTGAYQWLEFTVADAPTIEYFRARPLENGDGSWELSWETDADQVTISGSESGGPLASTGTLPVIASVPQQFVLTALRGSSEQTAGPITLAGLQHPALLQPAGPQQLTVGGSLQLRASVTAPGSDVEPSQKFRWISTDESVVTVSDGGQVNAVGTGRATVRATNAQWNGAYGETQFTVVAAPEQSLTDFRLANPTAVDWYAGSEIEVAWDSRGLDRLELRVTGSAGQLLDSTEVAAARGFTTVALPLYDSAVNLELLWHTADGAEHKTMLYPAAEPLPGWFCTEADSVITFADPRVEAAVRELPYVNRGPSEPIRCADVQPETAPLPYLDADGMEQSNRIILNRCYTAEELRISSTEGLQHLNQLARLELECNRINDIRFLRTMTGLTEINFDNNHIADLSPLAGLQQLEVVGLYNNRVRDAGPLAQLTGLRILYLSANHVQDVSPLAGLPHLELLWLFLNCQNLTYTADEEPDWGHDCLQDVSPLAGVNSLQSLVLLANDITDISFLNPGMTSLELVLLAGNSITDVTALQELPALTSVVLSDNPITDLSPLSSNEKFPAGEPYGFTRGTVSMPPRADDGAKPFPGHLMLGFNCLSEPDAQLEAFAAEVTIDIVNNDKGNLTANCPAGLTALSAAEADQRKERLWALYPVRHGHGN